MRFEIDIDYPIEKMELSRKRLEARNQFRILDRVPVNYCVVARYFAPIFGLRYLDFFKDAETQYYWLLQFAKYHIENIPCDICTEPVISVLPYFDNAIPPSAQGRRLPGGRIPTARPPHYTQRRGDGALPGSQTRRRTARHRHPVVVSDA